MQTDELLSPASETMKDLELCFQWMRGIPERRIEPVDALIVLGNAAAIRTAGLAAHLYGQGVAPIVVCCGGRGRGTEHFTETEAGLMASILYSCDVPASALIIEEHSRNTRENIEQGVALLDEQDLPRKRLLLVHDNGGLRRDRNLLWRCLPRYGEEGDLTALHYGWGNHFEDVALCGAFGGSITPFAELLTGSLQRTVECTEPPHGWQMPDEPPPDVLAAYERLKIQFPGQLIPTEGKRR